VPKSISSYRLLAWAIENRVPLICLYGRHPRLLCPIILGLDVEGVEKVLGYQFGGETSKGSLGRPAWKCFRVAGLSQIEAVEAEWQAGAGHSQRQTCVADVDYDVNEESPYAPRQSLGRLRDDPFPASPI